MQDQFVTHGTVVAFADEKVNLKTEDLDTYRAQGNRLRDKLEKYIAEHDGFDLVKMLNSGSVAKGTALRTINDLDLAVYVEAGKPLRKRRRFSTGPLTVFGTRTAIFSRTTRSRLVTTRSPSSLLGVG